MATNWPPASAPTWPPPEIGVFAASDIKGLLSAFREAGFTRRNPTSQENNTFFKNAACSDGHAVIGQMIVSPGGVAYPFAVCNNVHRILLAPYPPYEMSAFSGVE